MSAYFISAKDEWVEKLCDLYVTMSLYTLLFQTFDLLFLPIFIHYCRIPRDMNRRKNSEMLTGSLIDLVSYDPFYTTSEKYQQQPCEFLKIDP